MKVKICGMKYPDNIVLIASLLPDYMGFIFWEKSPRFFNGQLPSLPKSIKKVGVFVDAPIEEINLRVKNHALDVIQLHGNETPDMCLQLKRSGLKIIKVFSISKKFDFTRLEPFEKVCDYYLFDTKGKLPGGNGSTFDWNILNEYRSEKPFFISGGIGCDDIELIKKMKLPIYGVDMNSKLESMPGDKDFALCKKAIKN